MIGTAMDTMKILHIIAPGQPIIREVPIPEPPPGEVLMKIIAVTTCPHWDIHIMDGIPMFPPELCCYPYTAGQPGHEAMGEIVKLGPGTSGPFPGTRVAAWRDAGHHRQGCYAQYVCAAVENVIEIPSSLEPEAIAPLELAMCVEVSFSRLRQLDAVAGKRFGVAGLGPAGLAAIQIARANGAREVVGIDPLPARRQLALALGADEAIEPNPETFPSGRYGPKSLDAAIDCTGLKASIEFLMDRTRDAIAIFGVLRETVDYSTRHWGGLALLGYTPHNRPAAEKALSYITTGKLNLRPIVTHTMPLTDYAAGVRMLKSKEAVKICFRPWE